MPCEFLAIPLQRKGKNLTSMLQSDSTAGRSLFPGWPCTEGSGAAWLPGANGNQKMPHFIFFNSVYKYQACGTNNLIPCGFPALSFAVILLLILSRIY